MNAEKKLRKHKIFSPQEIADRLRDTAEFYKHLSETISDSGRPLHPHEIEAVRVGFYSWVLESTQEIRFCYLTGDRDRLIELTEEILDLNQSVKNLSK